MAYEFLQFFNIRIGPMSTKSGLFFISLSSCVGVHSTIFLSKESSNTQETVSNGSIGKVKLTYFFFCRKWYWLRIIFRIRQFVTLISIWIITTVIFLVLILTINCIIDCIQWYIFSTLFWVIAFFVPVLQTCITIFAAEIWEYAYIVFYFHLVNGCTYLQCCIISFLFDVLISWHPERQKCCTN